jgi:hypothetical protein
MDKCGKRVQSACIPVKKCLILVVPGSIPACWAEGETRPAGGADVVSVQTLGDWRGHELEADRTLQKSGQTFAKIRFELQAP